MGYTHYWRQKRDFTRAEWEYIKRTSFLIIERATAEGIVICGGDGHGVPKLNDDEIWLNGTDEGDLGHETFFLKRSKREKKGYESNDEYYNSGAFEFCKTAHKPYDKVVTAILYIANKVAPEAVTLSSDGDEGVFADHFKVLKDKKTTKVKRGRKKSGPYTCSDHKVIDDLGETVFRGTDFSFLTELTKLLNEAYEKGKEEVCQPH